VNGSKKKEEKKELDGRAWLGVCDARCNGNCCINLSSHFFGALDMCDFQSLAAAAAAANAIPLI
jgi:hypothetical protein